MSPPIKPERQDLSFALIGWTARETAIQASEFAAVRWVRFAPIHWTGARIRPETNKEFLRREADAKTPLE